MKPGYEIVTDTAIPFEFRDKSIAVINWHESNAVYMQTISSESVDHVAVNGGLVAYFKIKWKC